jgi:hypothetical protein
MKQYRADLILAAAQEINGQHALVPNQLNLRIPVAAHGGGSPELTDFGLPEPPNSNSLILHEIHGGPNPCRLPISDATQRRPLAHDTVKSTVETITPASKY